jgi:iron(III) transport system permease protein
VIALLLIGVSATLLFVSDRIVSGRRAFTTVTGKGGAVRRFSLGRWRWPLFSAALGIGIATSIAPVAILLLSSLTGFESSWTLHFWIGEGGGPLADGLPGLFLNPQFMEALWNTIRLGIIVAIGAMVLGLAVAYVIVRLKGKPIGTALSQLAFLPLLVPSIAFAAAYVALFGTPIGPFPSLYGTFALLVLAATANNLPYAVQSARSVLGQVSKDIEESAIMTGANFLTRMTFITFPLAIRGLLAGGILVFVKMVRDLSLVIFLTTAFPVLSILAYRYTGLGYTQYANAITMVILVICLAASLAAHLIQTRIQKWN